VTAACSVLEFCQVRNDIRGNGLGATNVQVNKFSKKLRQTFIRKARYSYGLENLEKIKKTIRADFIMSVGLARLYWPFG